MSTNCQEVEKFLSKVARPISGLYRYYRHRKEICSRLCTLFSKLCTSFIIRNQQRERKLLESHLSRSQDVSCNEQNDPLEPRVSKLYHSLLEGNHDISRLTETLQTIRSQTHCKYQTVCFISMYLVCFSYINDDEILYLIVFLCSEIIIVITYFDLKGVRVITVYLIVVNF